MCSSRCFCGDGEPFPQVGHNLPVQDLVTGTYRGRAFCAFTYVRRRHGASADTGPGERQRREFVRVVAVPTAATEPKLQVSSAGLGNTMLGVVGAGGLEFGDADFDEAFRVTTDDEARAGSVLTPEMRRFLLEDARARDLPFRFARDELTTWQRGPLNAVALGWSLDFLCDVLDRVPPPSTDTPPSTGGSVDGSA